jgi:hypothetical protein
MSGWRLPLPLPPPAPDRCSPVGGASRSCRTEYPRPGGGRARVGMPSSGRLWSSLASPSPGPHDVCQAPRTNCRPCGVPPTRVRSSYVPRLVHVAPSGASVPRGVELPEGVPAGSPPSLLNPSLLARGLALEPPPFPVPASPPPPREPPPVHGDVGLHTASCDPPFSLRNCEGAPPPPPPTHLPPAPTRLSSFHLSR